MAVPIAVDRPRHCVRRDDGADWVPLERSPAHDAHALGTGSQSTVLTPCPATAGPPIPDLGEILHRLVREDDDPERRLPRRRDLFAAEDDVDRLPGEDVLVPGVVVPGLVVGLELAAHRVHQLLVGGLPAPDERRVVVAEDGVHQRLPLPLEEPLEGPEAHHEHLVEEFGLREIPERGVGALVLLLDETGGLLDADVVQHDTQLAESLLGRQRAQGRHLLPAQSLFLHEEALDPIQHVLLRSCRVRYCTSHGDFRQAVWE